MVSYINIIKYNIIIILFIFVIQLTSIINHLSSIIRCGHCKTLAPEWAKAATTLKDGPLKLAKVDATVATGIAKTFGISGFPTIKYFKNGSPSDYDGGRTEKEIVNWVNKKSGPPAVTVTTVAELEKIQNANDAIVVGLFKSLDSELATAFLAFAGATSLDSPFVITASPEVLTKLGVTKDAIVVLKVFDEKRDDFDLGATLDSDALTNFVAAKTTPLIQDYSPSTSKKIFGSDIKQHALFFVNKNAADYSASATYDLLTETAKTHKGEVLFITVSSDNTGILGYFDLKESDLPKFIIINMAAAIKKYPLDIDSADLDAKAIAAHTAAFVAGSLTPTLKTEEPTPEDVAQPVKVVKGKSFNDLVINTKKDVLLEIYAPWCGHCKKLGKSFFLCLFLLHSLYIIYCTIIVIDDTILIYLPTPL